MDIKTQIGQRIMMARKAKGLTQTALAKLTGALKQSRLNNWEHGLRTPGITEIQQLATVLDVAPAYLLCLTDTKNPQISKTHIGALVPLLTLQQACDAKEHIQTFTGREDDPAHPLIPISRELREEISSQTFAIKMHDDSMEPELRKDDILIIDPDTPPKPANFVIAKMENNEEVIVRRYKLLTTSKNGSKFELLAINPHWGTLEVSEENKCELIGTVVSLNRKLR